MLAKLKRIPQKNTVSSSARLVIHILIVVVLMSTVLFGLFSGGHVQAADATVAEKKADAQATNTHITDNCENASLDSSGNNSPFFAPCVARFKAFYLGDGTAAPDCPADDGSTNYQICEESAPKNGLAQRDKDFPDLNKLCDTFISNAKGGSWPNFSSLNGSDKAAAIKQCNVGLAQGLTNAPGTYPSSSSCDPGGNANNKDTLQKACFAGRSLADAHIFTLPEAKASAKAGSLPMTDNSDNAANPGSGNIANNGASDGVSCDLGISLSVGGVLNAINPLNWLLCGIVKGMNLIVTSLDDQINSMLVLGTGGSTSSDNPNNIFADSNGNCGAQNGACANYYTAWRSFRNIALGLLVIVGLIVVISQALGMEILDAYTIRKMLPRVLIATIAIVLSWQLMRFCVTVSNDLGYGVGNLLDAPFHGLGQNIKVGGANGILATFALALGGIFFDLFGMLAFVGTAALAVIIAFFVLTLRQVAVILLIIFSPVAIIAYVLPNTQRVYKFWWESFSKMLLMFPMIVAFITAGHIFSAISSGEGSGFLHQTIAFIAYFAPYFAIPMTFRLSGAMMSGLGNAVNSRGETARNALSNLRSGRAKKNTAALGAGERFKGIGWVPHRLGGGLINRHTSNLAERLNRRSAGLASGLSGNLGIGQKGSEAIAQNRIVAGREAQKRPGLQAIAGYNDANRALTFGSKEAALQGLAQWHMSGGDDGQHALSPEDARARAAAGVRAAEAAGGFTPTNATAGFLNMARDGTAIRDLDDQAELAARIGGGNRNSAFLHMVEAGSLSAGTGRSELKPETGLAGDLVFAASDAMAAHGTELAPGALHRSRQAIDARFSAFGNKQMYEKMNQNRGRSIRGEFGWLAEVVNDEAGHTYTPDDRIRAAALMTDSLSQVRSGVGAQNKREEVRNALAPGMEAYDRLMAPVPVGPGETAPSPAAQRAADVGATGRRGLSEAEIEAGLHDDETHDQDQ